MKKKVLMPDYYPEFHCLADKCKFTCCQKWYINISRKNYQQIRKLRGSTEMADILKTAIKRSRPCESDDDYAHIQLNEKKVCPLLTENGLCGLQQEYGYRMIPDVCKTFPRQEQFSPVGIEHVCSSGCEAVVHLLIDSPKPIHFIVQEDEILLPYYRDFTNVMKTYPIFNFYDDIQRICIGILQNRCYSISNRIVLLGLALVDLEQLKYSANLSDVNSWIQSKSNFIQNNNSMQEALNKIQNDTWKSLTSSVLHCNMIMQKIPFHNHIFLTVFDNLNISVSPSNEEGTQINFNIDLYEKKKQLLFQNFPNFECMLENVMVNMFFFLKLPLINGDIWENYKLFCFLYNLVYFICIGYMDGDYKKDDLVYLLTVCSRMLLHTSQYLQNSILDLFKQTNVNSLADMITLISN